MARYEVTIALESGLAKNAIKDTFDEAFYECVTVEEVEDKTTVHVDESGQFKNVILDGEMVMSVDTERGEVVQYELGSEEATNRFTVEDN